MIDKSIKLVNPQKFNVGVKTLDRPLGMDVKAGSFILISEDDVNYIVSISDFIQRGILRIENAAGTQNNRAEELTAELGIDPENDPNFITDEEIQKKLSGAAKKLDEWLSGVTEHFLIDRVYDIAMSMQDKLTAPKLKVLKAKMPERDFIGEE